VDRRGAHGRGEVVLGEQIVDGVVDEHGIELGADPHRSHVAFQVTAPGVEASAHVEHCRSEVDERHLEMPLEVPCVAAAAAAELEDVADGNLRRLHHHPRVQLGLLRIVLGRRDERPPLGELGIEQGPLRHPSSSPASVSMPR
jgi:hypothetical protein